MFHSIKQGVRVRARGFAFRRHVALALAATVTLALVILSVVWWARSPAVPVAAPTAEPEAAPEGPEVVTLSAAKAAAADIETCGAEFRALRDERRVPGRIGYDEARRLEVKMPVEGMVVDVLAQPGDAVKQGDQLAVLSSVAVGLARDELIKSEADRALAERERDWSLEIARNLEALQQALKAEKPIEEIDRQFQDKALGDYRDKILSAYSRFQLAERTYDSSESLAGALPGITIRQRKSTKESAGASFLGICEQSRFEALRQRDAAQAALEHAERLVAVNRQQLRLQLGPYAELSATPDDATLCELVLRSSMDGLVEERLVAKGSRFTPSQTLFVVANTDKLWVSAHIYEREWAGFDPQSVDEVLVECPAVPEKPRKAKPLFVSVVASPESRAVPMVAEIDNADRRLKPGMFAWVTVPLGEPRQALVVPESAIARHESQPFVFVEQGDRTYRRVEVELGMTTPEWVEITKGIEPGDRVVSRGTFTLKSEWLLRSLQD